MELSLGSLFRRVFSRRFLKFGTVGVSGIAVNQGILYFAHEHVFNHFAEEWARNNLSLALAIFFATLNNFIWNRMWTWQDRQMYRHHPIYVQFGQYTLACWLSILLQVVFTNVLSQYVFYMSANLAAIAVTSVLNFVLNDIWTFGRVKLAAKHAPHEAERFPED
jgi:putative flippase GtrA